MLHFGELPWVRPFPHLGLIEPLLNKLLQVKKNIDKSKSPIHCARDIEEIIQRLDRVLDAPPPHNESISTRLPRNTDPCLVAEIRASTDGHPSYGETSHNPGQTSNSSPAILNSRSVSSHPRISMARGKPSVPVVSVPSNTRGNPWRDLHYPLVKLLLILDIPLLQDNPQYMFLPPIQIW